MFEWLTGQRTSGLRRMPDGSWGKATKADPTPKRVKRQRRRALKASRKHSGYPAYASR